MLWWFAQTSLIAAGLAALATLGGRWKRLGPEAKHALWLIVLIKFAIPPVVAWPWSVPDAWPTPTAVDRPASPLLPGEGPGVRGVASPSAPESGHPVDDRQAGDAPLPGGERVGNREEPFPAPSPPVDDPRVGPTAWQGSQISAITNFKTLPSTSAANPRRWDPRSVLLGLWLAGSVVVVVRRGIKVVRLQRAMARAEAAPAWLVEEARAIGEQVGVQPPPILATSGSGTPWLWCLARPRLIVPGALIGRLEPDRWPGILAHELAHLARRDHWVVRLELLLEAVWWWNPLFWHARRRLHDEAELACDARVVRALPERRFAYAEALVDVCEQLARPAIPSPALGVGGAGASRSLEGRLLMILRDPIPRRPSRRSALLATLLAALALPAWTLGQQPVKPDPPPSQPEAPAAKPDEPPTKVEPPTAKPEAPDAKPQASPAVAEVTIEAIRAAQDKRREALLNLSFRYIVAGRDQIRSALGTGVASRQAVRVGVADMVLDLKDQGLRLDVIRGIPIWGSTPIARQPEAILALNWDRNWDRLFFVRDGARSMALNTSWHKKGPVPFRWGWGATKPTDSMASGDTLARAIRGEMKSSGLDQVIDTSPASVLDLLGATVDLLSPRLANAEVAGVDAIDGREAVRVAWIASKGGLRGLCWLAPDLGFAVVRSDATMDPDKSTSENRRPGRRNWRKHASDFARIGDVWLPRQVTTEESTADPEMMAVGSEHISRSERTITFEDYRIGPAPADAFRPRLTIQSLDDASGEFAANLPELPAGLVDRLKRAVRESPFGPPFDGMFTNEPKPDALPQASRMGGFSGLPDHMTAPFRGRFLPAPKAQTPGPGVPANPPATQPGADAAAIDPGIIARPAPDFADPIPVAEPKKEIPLAADLPADRESSLRQQAEREASLRQQIVRRFETDPEVRSLAALLQTANQNVAAARRVAHTSNDPAILAAKQKVSSLETKYRQLWETKSQAFREELTTVSDKTRDDVELLQIRRDRKAAELRKFEARRDMARVELMNTESLANKQGVSRREVSLFEGKLKVAEAEVEGAKTELDEADLFLNQARRRLGPVAASNALRTATDTPSGPTLPELRDAVELMQIQLQGKKAELVRVEAQVELARLQSARIKALVDRNAVDARLADEATAKFQSAEGEGESKKIEVREFEVRLKQAERRVAAEEVRLRRAIERAKSKLDWSENMIAKGYVSQGRYDEDRGRYDELMLQLDPKHVPTPAVEKAPDPGPTAPLPPPTPKP